MRLLPTTLDRYLVRQFVQVFLICFVSLTGLYVVIDAFGNLDEFIEFADEEGGLLGVLSRYYGYRSLVFFDRMSASLALVAAMFTITWLQRHQEMTALSAAGVPTLRIIAPVLIAAASLSLLAVANRELALPRVRQHLTHNAQNLKGDTPLDVQPRFDSETEIYIRGSKTLAAEARIHKPNFMLPAELERYGRYLIAEDAYYHEAAGDRPAGYLFRGVTDPHGITRRPSLNLLDEPVVLTPVDYDWLAEDECFVVSSVTFDMLAAGSSWYSFASTAEILRNLRNPTADINADVRVTAHRRFVQPFWDVTLLFLGLPLVFSRRNRNVFVAIGLCVVITSAFMLVVMASQYLGANYLISPARSAWLPLLIFVPIAAAMSESLRS